MLTPLFISMHKLAIVKRRILLLSFGSMIKWQLDSKRSNKLCSISMMDFWGQWRNELKRST
uniref:Uncharacterized protein n=1 Tax=Arundo donax TaxID=35708 RepID=A0A0A8Z7S9_ARUDO